MKLLLLPLLAAAAGAGWLGLDTTPAAEDCASDCRMTVECVGDDTCLVTCFEADGSIRCQEEVTCDEPCDRPCDEPCDVACDEPCDSAATTPAAPAASAPAETTPACTPSKACSR
jgi:hypothetical protein